MKAFEYGVHKTTGKNIAYDRSIMYINWNIEVLGDSLHTYYRPKYYLGVL